MGLTKPQMYTEFADGINTVFYDANSVIGLVFGEEEASAARKARGQAEADFWQ